MIKEKHQFAAFITALALFGIVGRLLIDQPSTRGFELPIGIAWIIGLLATIGFIVSGRAGAKALVSSTLLMWIAAIVCGSFIAWMVIAGAGRSL